MTGFTPDHAHARPFRDALGSFATGVTVVTIATPDGPEGMTVNSFTSVSLLPPLVLWSPGKASRRHNMFAHAPYFCVHVLAEDQKELALRFAQGKTPFEGLATSLNARGVPTIEGMIARFDCRRVDMHDAGDHSLVIGHVEHVETRPGRPLIFAQGEWGGFSPERQSA